MNEMTAREYYENEYGTEIAERIMDLLEMMDNYERYSSGWYTANSEYENYMRTIDPNFRSEFDPDDLDEDDFPDFV